MDIRKLASIGSLVLGVILILGGIGTWTLVNNTLGEQRITVPEGDDYMFPGREVRGPFTAYAQTQAIELHTMRITDGQTYAELDREDPRRATAMNASFLQASLFTSILAFGVSAMAIGMGVLFVLIGLGIKDVNKRLAELAGAPS
ncbi:MAG: hypothetical protein WD358_04825, partial [Nitriliruptoraceae bacterium]